MKGEIVMRTSTKEVKLNLDKFLGLKELVDAKAIKKKEACAFLEVSPSMYNKLSAKIDALKGSGN